MIIFMHNEHMENKNLLGGAWLVGNYDIELVMPLQTLSRIGGRRATQVIENIRTETYVESMRPNATLRGHLTFHKFYYEPEFKGGNNGVEDCVKK